MSAFLVSHGVSSSSQTSKMSLVVSLAPHRLGIRTAGRSKEIPLTAAV